MSPADTEAFAIGRYADAALRCLDDVAGGALLDDGRAQAYATARRILVRLACEQSLRPGRDELGVGVTRPPSASLDSASLHEAALVEGRLLDAAIAREEERLAQTLASAHGGDPEELTARTVETALRSAGHPELRVAATRTVLGGRSKQTMFVDLAEPCDLPSRLVLRRDLTTSSLGTSVTSEFPLLALLFEAGVPVPEPFQLVKTPNALGQPFLLLQRLAGSAEGTLLRSHPSPARIRAAAVALAGLHAMPIGPFAPVLEGPGRGGPPLPRYIHGLRDEWRAGSRSDVAVMEAAFRYLLDAVPRDGAPTVVVHGDYSFHNLLFDGDELTAILDWELAHLGSPAEDLGYIRVVLRTVSGWEAFLDHYRAAGGRTVCAEDVRFHCVLSLVRLAVLMLRSREYFESGLTDSPLKADLAMYWLPRLLQQLSGEMREIISQPARSTRSHAAPTTDAASMP